MIIKIDAIYSVDEDREGISIEFHFRESYPEKPICKIQLDGNSSHSAGKVNTSTKMGLFTTPNIISLGNKETVTIEIWLGYFVVAGGLYQVDTKHEKYEQYVLRCICSYGIELHQDNYLDDIRAHKSQQWEDNQRDIQEGFLADLDAEGTSSELKGGMIHIYSKGEKS